jgi:hypothetical protein
VTLVRINEDETVQLATVLDTPLVQVLMLHRWSIFAPDGTDEHDAYEHMRRGRCMLCGEKLGEDTVIIVDAQGILGLWCSGTCLVDTHAISWLEDMLTEYHSKYVGEE